MMQSTEGITDHAGMSNPAGVNPFAIDDFGVDFEKSGDLSDFETFAEVFMDAVRAKNRSQWLIGDLYLWSKKGAYQQDIEDVLSASDLSLGTIQNYASTCNIWQKARRVVPVSFSHYTDASKLARVDMVAALKLLADAKTHGLGREYVRDEAKKALGIPDPLRHAAVLRVSADGTVTVGSLPTWTWGKTFPVTLNEGKAA